MTEVVVGCADFMCPAVQGLGSAYQRVNPYIVISVVQRASTLAYPMLVNGDLDIAILAWLPDKRAPSLWLQPMVYDGLAIIVHPQNGVPGLTIDQLQKLYQGQVENWQDWGGLPGLPQLISRETAASEYQYLQTRVMREIRTTLNASLAPDTEFMRKLVQENPLAVGYLSSAWLSPGVRAVAIEGIPPGTETIRNQIYPLTRRIDVVSLQEPAGAARTFIEWLLTTEGQELLRNYGFVSILE
ncbi:MAG: substrate-binding domain-containing protein [Anaerolineae bacterium]|nr:substrate-binding domain-containing protein [Anaerolineae bacterium]